MPPEINTLEDARAEILRLEKELATSNTEKENYSKKIEELTRENENVRELNQKYFLELRAQNNEKSDEDEPDEDVPTLEEFAKTLTI